MLAVAGGKGGAGKTTTTLGLAGALARQRRVVLTADADREMPDLHAMAGVARRPGLDAVAAGWSSRFAAGVADAPTCGVRVLPAGSGPADGRATGRSPPDSDVAAVGRAEEWADSVLLDCPAGAGPDAVAPLRAADAVVVVTTAEPACLRDTAKTAAMARELGTPVAGAVVSRATEAPEGVSRLLECPLLGTVPDAGITPCEKSGDGPPSSDRDPLADERVRSAHDRLVSALQPKYL
ncbi:MinD/ParA family ATP-binding protein [Halorussus lipolyticus]|uniref:MinD/ParA family ATP-binding protein n=1 Tax=Halorussus lipolyticus TaxID=3034024 RepID=UPI0023E7C3FE|nr:cellulose synthase operon protein YhjQ/BcsQ [Halorussus sp. DT80]